MPVPRIILALIGVNPFPELEGLKQHLSRVFNDAQLSVNLLPGSLLEIAFSPRRRQYNSTKLLIKLAEMSQEFQADRVLGIVDVDLYAGGLNFVFGEAQFPGKFAVISLYRLKPKYYGETDGNLFLSRIRKEAVHELGHTFGLAHCPDSKCVMHFSNSVYDTDFKMDVFCMRCNEKLSKALKSPTL